MSQIVTGEAVAIDLRVARLGSRLLATLIDLFIQYLIAAFLLGLAVAIAPRGDAAIFAALGLSAYLVAMVGYPVLMETLWHGRTLGKAVIGLRVVRDDGGVVRFRQVLGRAVVRAAVELPTFGLFSILSALLTKRSKRLGDLLVGTIAVQERIPVVALISLPMPPPLAGWATTLDLSRLSDGLAMSSRQLLARAGSLEPASRERLGMEIVDAVRACVTPPPPPAVPGWAYLAAVLAERRRREEVRLGSFLQAPSLPGARAAPGYGVAAPAWGAGPPGPSPGPPPYGRPAYGAPPYPPTQLPSPTHAPPGYPPPPTGQSQPAVERPTVDGSFDSPS